VSGEVTDETKHIREQELIASAVRGDKDAFGELVVLYESMVYNIIVGEIGRCEDAYDVSQEVFFKAYRSIRKFRGDCKFSTWLYRISINACMDFLRSSSRKKHISLSEYDEEDTYERQTAIPDDPANGPEMRSEKKDEAELVWRAIESLNPIHKRIIILRDIDGYSYDEIAEMLDLEEGTVKSRINRARKAIKEYLEKRNFF